MGLDMKIENKLNERIALLEGLYEPQLNFSYDLMGADNGNFYPLDLLAFAAIKRSISLHSAMLSLIRDNNYFSAASLLRLQIDSCMRFYAVFLVDDPQDFATKVLAGEHIRKLKDRNGNKLTDAYLIDALSEHHKWVKNVYKTTSGFVHLSNKHLFSYVEKVNEEERSVSFVFGQEDKHIDDAFWIEMIDGFIDSTKALYRYLNVWYQKKMR